ncbi:MAG: PAS sensor protein [Bacteroidales bacterium]
MEWIEKLDGNVIVSGKNGVIVYMNEKAINQYVKDGEESLIGKNLMDCHNEFSQKKIREIMDTGRNNIYTIEKKGKKKLIFQTPWFVDGVFSGIVELSLEIPFEMPHFVRD